MTNVELRSIPNDLKLKSGAHSSFKEGACVMEAVAWLAEEQFSDAPSCACPVVAAFARRLNDRIPTDEMRTELLLPLVTSIAGSKSTREVESKRRWMAADWAVRFAAPSALRSAARHPRCSKPDELRAHADKLEALPEVTRENSEAARAACRKARDAAADAADAAYAAADAAYAAYTADAAYAAADAAYTAADAYAAADAAYAAYTAAYAAADAARLEVFRSAADLLARMCAVRS